MKNVEELRKELDDVFQDVKSGKTNVQIAKALISASNAMLKSAQLELEQNKMTGSKKEIKFLKTP